MRRLLRSLFRWLARPGIWFVRWAGVQDLWLTQQRYLRRFQCEDPSTVTLKGDIDIRYPERCTIGKGVVVHEATWQAYGGITIGNYVHFGPRVSILTVNHNYEGDAIPYDEHRIAKPVIIEDCVWVGADVVITPGTHIEEGAIIAMGAVVSGHIPKGAIVGGAKWRILKQRDLDHYERLKAEGKFH